MINEKMRALGAKRSVIRELFEYGKKRKAEICENDWQKRIDALANEAVRRGVTFTQAHAPGRCEPFIAEMKPTDEVLDYYLEIMRRTIIACEMLGIKWMTVHPFSDNINTEYDTEILKKTNLDFYAPILEFAKAHGVGLAFENMARFTKFSMLTTPPTQLPIITPSLPEFASLETSPESLSASPADLTQSFEALSISSAYFASSKCTELKREHRLSLLFSHSKA